MGTKQQQQQDGSGDRRAERLPLDEAARLRPNSWSSLEIRILDLSRAGFRGQCDARLQRGGSVTLGIPGIGDVEAQVEWQRGGHFGARFFQPIALESCGWTLGERHNALARLLVERAAARRAGRHQAESRLKSEILSSLTMRKGAAAG
jgi:hypothetical protein